jgi:hypothetical protein
VSRQETPGQYHIRLSAGGFACTLPAGCQDRTGGGVPPSDCPPGALLLLPLLAMVRGREGLQRARTGIETKWGYD